jgi:hypothetical protein
MEAAQAQPGTPSPRPLLRHTRPHPTSLIRVVLVRKRTLERRMDGCGWM